MILTNILGDYQIIMSNHNPEWTFLFNQPVFHGMTEGFWNTSGASELNQLGMNQV